MQIIFKVSGINVHTESLYQRILCEHGYGGNPTEVNRINDCAATITDNWHDEGFRFLIEALKANWHYTVSVNGLY